MRIFVLQLLCIVSLAFGRYHIQRSRSDILGQISADDQDDDIYFEGEHQIDDGLPEVDIKDLPANGEIFEEDIVMDDSIRRAVLGLNNKRSALALSEEGLQKHWPKGIVPYEFEDKILPLIEKRIHEVIKFFNHYTCIRYVPKQEKDKDYVLFSSKGEGCSSSVGRVGGEQKVHLSSGCSRFGTVAHEMMHVIGILHEQSRPDRDEHVKVNFDNIDHKLVHNFRKYGWYEATNLDVEYNFNSVMHYGNYAFSNNGKRTLESKVDPDLKFGQRKQVTNSDVIQINNLYKCHVSYKKDSLLRDLTDSQVLQDKQNREAREEKDKRNREAWEEEDKQNQEAWEEEWLASRFRSLFDVDY